MTKRLLIAVFAVGLMAPLPSTSMASIAAAQERTSPAPTPPPPPPAPPQAPPAPPPAPPAPPQAPPPPQAQMSGNIQLDIVITDTQDGKPEQKTMSMLLRNGARSSIRSNGGVPVPAKTQDGVTFFNFNDVSLNLDATAVRGNGNQVQVSATFEFSTAQSGAGDPRAPTNLTQRIEVAVQSGKTLLVSRSADPVTDRTVTVELTATIREP